MVANGSYQGHHSARALANFDGATCIVRDPSAVREVVVVVGGTDGLVKITAGG